MNLTFIFHNDFRGGSRRAKRVSFRKRRTSLADNKESIAVEKEPLKEQSTAVDVDTVSNNDDIETQEEPEITWSSILFAVLKILILGIAVFIYDIYSK